MKKILIIDDDSHARFALRELLKKSWLMIEARDGEEGIRLTVSELPDLVLLDLHMPGMSGIEVCERLRENPRTRKIPVVMLTGCDSRSSRLRGLDSGADDYVSRPFDPQELIARIRARFRSLEIEARDERPLLMGNLSLDPRSCEVKLSHVPLSLTQIEFELLRFFLERPNQVICRKAALRALWPDSRVTARTIDTHVAHLRKKLRGSTCPIETVFKMGYMLKAGDPHATA